MGKIARGQSRPPSGKIPAASPPQDELLRFSFKLLDLSNPKFSTSRCGSGYVDRFLRRLRDLSAIKVGEFRSNKSKAIRAHRIDFPSTTEPNGFASLNAQLREVGAWQFEITVNEHGRVHGILIDETFYVVWIDPEHRLYA